MRKSVLFFFLIMLPALVFSGGQPEVEIDEIIGTVEYYDGDVVIDNEPVDFGMKVPFGAVVKTGAESYCEIVFDRKNIFRIQESTIAEIRISPTNPEIILKQGTFAALFNKLSALTKDEPFRIRTQSAIAGVRGTAFFVKVLDENNTYICICNGELGIQFSDGDDAGTISSGHHKAYYYRNTNGKTSIETAPLLYHNDEAMEALAEHIEEKIDWYY